ncbi:D-glycero-beta-D-manno-heptose-1,7-bisphosphate 7-phosphatase [Geothermobacter hydrogeniphilus]|uniref:D,D-heptose 1,7-bisphosphate phosphatase n=1 Tax=Geothermobacter hydrogeniphilus TaxID=1969733 RepID=A0A2K2HCL4_9BACT|nr:D-glycero-beta-D-manno-heptose-1,7-bisphosphate 7-phosphatase [Geothermobacter hydrogeniphilus]
MKPAVFLDRDGTINVEKNYLFRVEDFEFIDGVPAAIRRLNRAGLPVVVITNQSGIARGFYGLSEVETLHRHVDRLLAVAGARIDAWYICPHLPDYSSAKCDCRKPAPGLLLRAAAERGIDLARSWMVGDKPADIRAGLSVGCGSILVKTGYGNTAVAEAMELKVPVVETLVEAVDLILRPGSGLTL